MPIYSAFLAQKLAYKVLDCSLYCCKRTQTMCSGNTPFAVEVFLHGLSIFFFHLWRNQQLNYFNLGNKLYIVDMTGYGFAQAPDSLVKKWQKMIFAYLQGRVNLKRVFLLIDSRHGIKKVDSEIMEMLDKAAVNYQIILTKTDKISAVELAKVINETNKIIKEHAAAHINLIATSSEKNRGIDELRAEIAGLI